MIRYLWRKNNPPIHLFIMKNTVSNSALLLALLALPFISYAQAPPLGRVATFALFTGGGAFNNTGNSVITGDIGTNSGLLTGFPPGTVNGSIHIADSVTTLAATNLGTAYASLSALTCDSTIGATLGNGQILTPKVYCIVTLATINGNLTLNALGNPNAIFVIKVNGALNTATSTQILLTNSANINNIFWQVNGAFTLADSSNFKGTIVANGAISLLAKSAILGRGLTTTGAISIQNTNNLLPIDLISFKANCNKKNILFQWFTASEKNNHYFTIESSPNQYKWTSLARINGAGTSNIVNTYTYQYLNELTENKYFRLKQTDMDGSSTYSDVVLANTCDEEKITVELYPNPATGIVSLSYTKDLNLLGSITVYNILGNKVFHTEGFPVSINLSAQPNGIYFMHFNTNGKNIVEKIMINHFQ